ncbi:MAG: MCE family protein [Bacteroidales bacterium]|nr:MCE family protein [Bacteroidales bacterium]
MSKKIFKTQEIKIAVLALISLFLLIWGIRFLKGKNIFKKQLTYYGIFEETAGLTPANSVTINGVPVGIIDKITLCGTANEKVLVTFSVQKKTKIPLNSELRIISPGIVGSMQLECVLGDDATCYKHGDTIIGYIKPNMLAGVGDIKNNLDTIVESVKILLQEGDIQTSINHIHTTTARLDSIIHSGKIEKIISNVQQLTYTIKQNDTKIDSIIDNVNQFSGTLKETDIPKTLDELSRSLKQLETVLSDIRAGEGTIGQLTTNDSMYKNLDKTIINLDELIKDIKANPKRYINVTIFGGKKK